MNVCVRTQRSLLCQIRRISLNISDSDAEALNKYPSVRCPIDNPGQHCQDHLGMFYSITNQNALKIMPSGIHKYYLEYATTFKELPIMIRSPALEVIDRLKTISPRAPPIKFIFYGQNGCGKTMSMTHVLHYCLQNDWIVVHVNKPLSWLYTYKSLTAMECDPTTIVQPTEASKWLEHFKAQNEDTIRRLDVRTTETHVWSRREETPKGSSLMDIVDQGINRSIHACDSVKVLLGELRDQAGDNLKVLTAIDGVNAFWDCRDGTIHRRKYWKRDPNHFVLIRHFKEFITTLKFGMTFIFTVDPITPTRMTNFLPKSLLTDKGFSDLDPFIPVEVPTYSRHEITNCWLFLVRSGWIMNTAFHSTDGLEEMIFTSGSNPFHFFINSCSL